MRGKCRMYGEGYIERNKENVKGETLMCTRNAVRVLEGFVVVWKSYIKFFLNSTLHEF